MRPLCPSSHPTQVVVEPPFSICRRRDGHHAGLAKRTRIVRKAASGGALRRRVAGTEAPETERRRQSVAHLRRSPQAPAVSQSTRSNIGSSAITRPSRSSLGSPQEEKTGAASSSTGSCAATDLLPESSGYSGRSAPQSGSSEGSLKDENRDQRIEKRIILPILFVIHCSPSVEPPGRGCLGL